MAQHRILIDEASIRTRVAALAGEIARDVPEPRPIFVGLLTGSFVFVADLIRAATGAGIEPLVDFMAVSHYGAGTESDGIVQIHKGLAGEVRDRSVLLVDDILDTGLSLRLVRDHIAARAPAWLRTCVLLDKPSRRVTDIRADYVGFAVPDVWVIGYGLDAGGTGRGLPYVAALEADPAMPADAPGK